MSCSQRRLIDLAELKVQEFLDENPTIDFDIEEFLLGLTCRDELLAAMRAFDDSLDGGGGRRISPQLLINRVTKKAEFISAYSTLSRACDFSQIPFVTKGDLRISENRFLSAEFANMQLWKKTTTGSSGAPLTIWYNSLFYFDLLHLALPKVLRRVAPSYRGYNNRVFCLSISDNHNYPNSVFVDPTGLTGLSLQIIVDGADVSSFDYVFDLIDRYRPTCISSKPSLLEVFTHSRQAECGPTVSYPVSVISSGSTLTDELRFRLQAGTTGTIVNAYAMTEFGLIASECAQQFLHVDTTTVFVEAIDDRGLACADGEVGELVVSSVHNAAMPLIRYRTGDRGAILKSPCPCGMEGPRISPLMGRMIKCFPLPSGRLFPPTCFNDIFKSFPSLTEFQITQRAHKQFEILAEIDDSIPDKAFYIEQLLAYFRQMIPEDPVVDIRAMRFAHDSKFQRYRSDIW
jgi:phenylacetate-CoA ligase